MSHSDVPLPSCWRSPTRYSLHQRYLFGRSTDDVLAELRVSRDDVRHWRRKDWISFDIDAFAELEPPLEDEIEFIRDLARSGLSDALVNHFLKGLSAPYRYNKCEMAFHFEHGWVSPSVEEPFEVIEEHLDNWLTNLVDEGDWRRLKAIGKRIEELLMSEVDDEEVSDEGDVRDIQ